MEWISDGGIGFGETGFGGTTRFGGADRKTDVKADVVNYASAKKEDLGAEKHVPVVTTNGSMVTVRVGSVEHPMTEEHYIEWIELQTNFDTYRKVLAPGEAPEANFVIGHNEILTDVYAMCNIHGLWMKSMPRYIRTSSCMGEVVDWHSGR